MALTLDQTLHGSARLIATALALQALELFALRGALSDTGIWRFGTLEAELSRLPPPLAQLSRLVLPARRFLVLLSLQLALAGVVLWQGLSPLLVLLTVQAQLIALRFRGTFNGGSDAMTLLVLICLSVAALGRAEPLVARGAIGYLGVQTLMSYFVAGIIKLKEHSWRDGSALAAFVALPKYAVPLAAQRVLQRNHVARALAWLVMLFETSFPLALLSRRICVVYLLGALCFHLANALLLGLNRFVLSWASAYPTLLYLSQYGPLENAP